MESTISASLSIIERMQKEYDRLLFLRSRTSKEPFKERTVETEPIEHWKERKLKFFQDKIKKLKELDTRIEEIRNKLIENKCKISEANARLGIDQRVKLMGYLKNELSNIQGISKSSSVFSRFDMDGDLESDELYDTEGKIKELEKKIADLSQEIQSLNSKNKITVIE